MAEAARKRMTVEQFLRDDSLEEGRYELIEGVPVMMAPPVNLHAKIGARLTRRISEALDRRPGREGFQQVGIRSLRRRDSLYIADLAVSCAEEPDPEREMRAPILVVEILSPSTEAIDRRVKLLDYRNIASVQEILFVDAREVFCEVHRRRDIGWQTDVLDDIADTLRLESIGLKLPLREVYKGFHAAAPARRAARGRPKR